mmetsp:Transcript_17363/g.42781  ORF Transcript_17363/g.42781 Transcript_17363/m.42781 type:complete len:527 (+) Transcript_17363:864-2444(+)
MRAVQAAVGQQLRSHLQDHRLVEIDVLLRADVRADHEVHDACVHLRAGKGEVLDERLGPQRAYALGVRVHSALGHDVVRDVGGGHQVRLGLDAHALGSEEHRLHAAPSQQHRHAVDEVVQGVGADLPRDVHGGGALVVPRLRGTHHASHAVRERLDSHAEHLWAVSHRSLGRPQHGAARLQHGAVVLAPPHLQRRQGKSHEVALDDALHIPEGDHVAVRAHRQDGRLVHQRGQSGTAVPVRELRRAVEHRVLAELGVARAREVELPGVNLEDGEAVQGGLGNPDVEGALEAPRAQQRRVQLRAEVRGAHHQHHLLFLARDRFGLESVELDEKLHEAGLALERGGVAAAVQRAAAADGVQLVDEDDGRRHLPRAFEQIAHPLRRHAHEHLHELGAVGVKEWHPGLPRHRLGQQRLACSGGSLEQHALGDAEPGARRLHPRIRLLLFLHRLHLPRLLPPRFTLMILHRSPLKLLLLQLPLLPVHRPYVELAVVEELLGPDGGQVAREDVLEVGLLLPFRGLLLGGQGG